MMCHVRRLMWFAAWGLLLACQPDVEATTPVPDPPAEEPQPVDTVPPTPVTYLALGDSYTIGHAVAEAGRFPLQLADSLRRRGLLLPAPRIIARTGWTTDELQAAINQQAATLDSNFQLVSLLIGVNNQYRGRPVAPYRLEFAALLQQAIALAGGRPGRVVVVSIPDYAYTPFGNGSPSISAGIDAYNAANREITLAAGVRYVDITPISREGLQNPGLVATDGLHPSAAQYTRWVQLLLPEVLEMLGE